MTTLDLDENHARYQIRAFKPGAIQVNETIYSESLIIMPEKLIEHWSPQTSDQLSSASFAEIIALKPDILLIGTGATLIFLPVEMYGDLINQGIGVEVMNTSAACRTYNALSAEGRNVAAALVIR